MDWKDKIKKAVGIKPKETKELTSEEVRRKALDAEKAQATKDKKPWVAVLDTQVNPDNIRNGFFELDWNDEFVNMLRQSGYEGQSEEDDQSRPHQRRGRLHAVEF